MEGLDRSPRKALWFPVGVLWSIAALPVALWAGMFVHAVRAWRFLGRWPAPNNPDPKALPRALQSESIEACVMAATVALIIAVGVEATRRSQWKVRFIAAAVGVVVLWAAWFVVSRVDPGRIVEWYLD